MEDENLLDDELAGPSTNVDSPATFSKKLIRKFGICHGSTGTDAVTHNNNIANKVVCAQILHELDAEASVISNTAVCPWDYICDYKADRFLNYLFKARCKTSMHVQW